MRSAKPLIRFQKFVAEFALKIACAKATALLKNLGMVLLRLDQSKSTLRILRGIKAG